ncbi:hypothetical protein AAMO2058_000153100 [Amorphochlora amoebiformis]
MDALDRLIHYVVNTSTVRIQYRRTDTMPEAYVDASFAQCKETGKSVSGHVVNLADGPVVWSSHRQKVVANSTTESEYIACSECVRDVIYVRELLTEFGVNLDRPVNINEDNQPAIAIATKEGLSKKSRSIRVSYHNVRYSIRAKEVRLIKVASEDNVADILTKPLANHPHKRLFVKMFQT